MSGNKRDPRYAERGGINIYPKNACGCQCTINNLFGEMPNNSSSHLDPLQSTGLIPQRAKTRRHGVRNVESGTNERA